MEDILRFMTAGSVDDGKSTLIGRLFHDSGLILDDQMKAISKHGLNLAYFTDGLKEERELGITIDVAYRYFETPKRKFVVADAPGHREFTRNMITGLTHSDAVIILIDATLGISEQTRRHLFLTRWLEIKSVAILINKMDLINYDQKKFQKIKDELGLMGETIVIPISALEGKNVLTNSTEMPWYKGPHLFQWLHSVPGRLGHVNEAVRFPVQLSSGDEVSGTLKSGAFAVGDKLRVNASEEFVTIKNIMAWPLNLDKAEAGMALKLKLDRKLNRGDLLTDLQIKLSQSKNWEVEWSYLLERPFLTSDSLVLKYETKEVAVENIVIQTEYDLDERRWDLSQAIELKMNGIYRGRIQLKDELAADIGGKFAFIDQKTGQTVAAGILKMKI